MYFFGIMTELDHIWFIYHLWDAFIRACDVLQSFSQTFADLLWKREFLRLNLSL